MNISRILRPEVSEDAVMRKRHILAHADQVRVNVALAKVAVRCVAQVRDDIGFPGRIGDGLPQRAQEFVLFVEWLPDDDSVPANVG
jgi:hypothetical protein